MRIFVDSSIPMYVAGKEHPNQEPVQRFLARVRNGEVEACTSTEVLQEILYRYSALGKRELACEVYDLFVEICLVLHRQRSRGHLRYAQADPENVLASDTRIDDPQANRPVGSIRRPREMTARRRPHLRAYSFARLYAGVESR